MSGVTFNNSNPNVATGIGWTNCTITMSANGQTLTATSSLGTETWTRSNHSINGVWAIGTNPDGLTKITISGTTATYSSLNPTQNALTQDAINKGYIAIGTQAFRNLTSTGNLTWSGEVSGVTFNNSNPNVATGIGWASCTITISANGQTLTATSSLGTETWTRHR